MGSGVKRKKNDQVRINVRKTGGGGSAGGSNQPHDINDLCPMAFDVIIRPGRALPDGIAVTKKDNVLFVRGEPVGKLSPNQLQRMKVCAGNNIRYSAHVVNKDKKTYARFQQIT